MYQKEKKKFVACQVSTTLINKNDPNESIRLKFGLSYCHKRALIDSHYPFTSLKL